ncbi:hypothetical protein [Mesorhizobium sp. BHbdii]
MSLRFRYEVQEMLRYPPDPATPRPSGNYPLTILAHHPPRIGGAPAEDQICHAGQDSPASLVVSCSRPDAMPQSYVRYLSNSLREAFDMPGVPIRIALRTSEIPFAGKAKKRR